MTHHMVELVCRTPWWNQVRCSGSSSIATSACKPPYGLQLGQWLDGYMLCVPVYCSSLYCFCNMQGCIWDAARQTTATDGFTEDVNRQWALLQAYRVACIATVHAVQDGVLRY